ncbi:MAG: universal stress protein [Desulfobacterales bacterium]
MFKRILMVFENDRVFEQALSYCRELALRMDSEATLLVLVEMDFKHPSIIESRRKTISQAKQHMGRILTGLSADFVKSGIPVSVAIRVGDPAQELLKFLAERETFHTIIWGSGEKPPYDDDNRRHWMKKVMETLECPLITVSARKFTGKQQQGKY